MFTWNFQYISKARLAETFGQLVIGREKGSILVRIHTAIHSKEEAQGLAGFIKQQLPDAVIVGSSTSAPIGHGHMIFNQCLISLSLMKEGNISSYLVHNNEALIRKDMSDDPKLILCMLAGTFIDGEQLISKLNEVYPGVPVTGGIVDISNSSYQRELDRGFVFDETGCYDDAALLAVMCGTRMEYTGGYSTGIKLVETDIPLSKLAKEFTGQIPEVMMFTDDGRRLISPDAIGEDVYGDKLSMAFLCDTEMVADDRKLFRRIENFRKAELLFGYSCASRASMYRNCSGWELSAYDNSNMGGCVTLGIFANENGRAILSDGAFTVAAAGEDISHQKLNPNVFSYTEALSADNRRLLSYMMKTEKEYADGREMPGSLKRFISACESAMLINAETELANKAALNMDMSLKGYDRICIIDVLDVTGMKTVFPEKVISITKGSYISKCSAFARDKSYRLYRIDDWQLAIAAPSYMVRLSEFTADMEKLQRELFKTLEGTVAIVPTVCVIDDCTPDTLYSDYNVAVNRMARRNLQFYVYDADADKADENTVRERYHMVDVIGYAIDNDLVIPYYQGIHDNRNKRLSHYEALMRIKDENGRIYYPGEFLGVARNYGLLYDTLSAIMIHKVFDRFKGYNDLSVSINIGMRDIRNRELVGFICDFLMAAVHPENFIFEILENEDVDDYETLLSFVDRIHSLGARIAIDDFGSGYSNLTHVINIHSDIVKIDGSIVRKCSEDKDSENIIALIAGWRNLSTRGAAIIAEYVENEEIQKKIESYGIDYSQGYLFSSPSPEIEES